VRTKHPSSYVLETRAESTVTIVDRIQRRETIINVLPDDVLLQIFEWCRVDCNPPWSPFDPALDLHRLIHICRRWRQVIFSSPPCLAVYLLCTYRKPASKNLGFWPAFPIVIDYINYPGYNGKTLSPNDEDNVIAALKNPDRVRSLKLPVTGLLLGKVASMTQEKFPMLTQLWLSSKDEDVSVLPSAFLGGSAACLQEIHLEGIPFPTLPTFLSSATNLVVLYLHRIPYTGYISPEVMVANLATLTRLGDLSIEFESSASPPDQSDTRGEATLLTRVVLPALTSFEFRGASDYLENLVAQIDAPRLASTKISYFDQLVFQVPHLFRFAAQAQVLEPAHFKYAQVNFRGSHVYIGLHSEQLESGRSHFALRILCQRLDWQVPRLAEVLSQSSPLLSNVVHLSIGAYDLQSSWQDEMDHMAWLELLRQFTAVKALRVSAQLAGNVADSLKDATVEMVPEIMPVLRLLFLEDESARRVGDFIITRQRFGLPVTLANSPQEFLRKRESQLL
jgi:hypothetical protein